MAYLSWLFLFGSFLLLRFYTSFHSFIVYCASFSFRTIKSKLDLLPPELLYSADLLFGVQDILCKAIISFYIKTSTTKVRENYHILVEGGFDISNIQIPRRGGQKGGHKGQRGGGGWQR